MNTKVIKLLKTTYGLLTFALLSGCAYYTVILKFILSHTSAGGGMLGFFFLPAIVFGAALIIVKLVKQSFENGREGAVLAVFWLHTALIAMSIAFAVSMLA